MADPGHSMHNEHKGKLVVRLVTEAGSVSRATRKTRLHVAQSPHGIDTQEVTSTSCCLGKNTTSKA
jgi:hypothetical protein